jgi:hypothetical protein
VLVGRSDTSRAATRSRDEALDYVKGYLVLFMVIYHWINYFIGVEWSGYRYLRFLTPSFIFITGFIISTAYLSRYASDDVALAKRLLIRGAKLLLLFIALNVAEAAVTLLLDPTLTPGLLWPGWRFYETFVTGEGGAAFAILVPIAYLLMLTPVVLQLATRARISLLLFGSTTFAIAIAVTMTGRSTGMGELLSFGLLGLAVGDFARRKPRNVPFATWLVPAAYGLYLVAITVWNVPFVLQGIGVPLTVWLLYTVSAASLPPGLWGRHVIQLGRYSLFAYIAQIAILRAIWFMVRSSQFSNVEQLLMLLTAAILTFAVVRTTDYLRSRITPLDTFYRSVFA